MKNVILILLVVVTVVLVGCEKKQCYHCTEVFNNGYTTPIVSQSDHCNWTQTDKVDYCQRNSKTWQNGNRIATSSVSCYIK